MKDSSPTPATITQDYRTAFISHTRPKQFYVVSLPPSSANPTSNLSRNFDKMVPAACPDATTSLYVNSDYGNVGGAQFKPSVTPKLNYINNREITISNLGSFKNRDKINVTLSPKNSVCLTDNNAADSS